MSEIKPVSWFTEDHLTDKSATTYDIYVVERWINKGWPVTAMVLHSDHEVEAGRLRAEVEAYRQDAERYRWLRQYNVDSYLAGGKGASLDYSIDAAMGASA